MKRVSYFLIGSIAIIVFSLPVLAKVRVINGRCVTKPSVLCKKNRNADTSLQVSLNGIDSLKAAVMINYFVENKWKDFRPTRQSVWFDSETIRNMYDLLKSERAQEKTGPDSIGLTDGFRIYFASDSGMDNGHLKNSIIIVSTKISGKDDSVPSGHKHKDYYSHSKNSALFKSPDSMAINGLIKRRQWINTRGENLYNLYFSSDDFICTGDRHYITRRKAKIMVDQFGVNSVGANDVIATTSEWFDFELLQSFVKDSHPHDGLRIYFARHPESYNNVCDTDKYKDAFILIPTEQAPFLFWNYHRDYFDCRSTEMYLYKTKLHRLTDGGGDDNGEICPTHCP